MEHVTKQDAEKFCHVLISNRVARYGYDVYRFDPSPYGCFYKLDLTSLEQRKRNLCLAVFEDVVQKTSEDGELAEPITRNLDDALRHLRAV